MNPTSRQEEGHSGVATVVEKLGGAPSKALEKGPFPLYPELCWLS
jgi:hypothetical protein